MTTADTGRGGKRAPRDRGRGVSPLLLAAALLAALAATGAARAAGVPGGAAMADWFEAFKASADDGSLYRLLYAMPKGGDLHSHLSGSLFPEWTYELALAQEARGYEYLTRVRIENCRPYGGDRFGGAPYLLHFVTILRSAWEALNECERGEYVPLADLDAEQKAAWLDSLRLDKPHEGRDEFFGTHWQRMNHVASNPYLAADGLVRHMQAMAREGVAYIEPIVGVLGHLTPEGEPMPVEEVAQIYRDRLAAEDAVATGVTVRLQVYILRFHPQAEETLRELYRFVAENNDLWVAVNMVGREDDDKGYPLRFLPVLRELRQRHHGVRLSIHAGEVDEPNYHVRDTLLLGAERIGHGVNLITDPGTLQQLRYGPYLVEINLISNLLLRYVSEFSEHPFPEYLRIGVPVALSTDDRGMWDSNLTDEFFVAVREFNLSWPEIVRLSRNSLAYSFAPEAERQRLLAELDERLDRFAAQAVAGPAPLAPDARSHGFLCRRYAVCELAPVDSKDSGS